MTTHQNVVTLAVALAAAMLMPVRVPLAQAPTGAVPPTGRAVLAGQVVEAGTTRPVAGVLVTLGGTPSPGGIVDFSFSQAAVPGGNRQTLTNDRGHFLFAGLPAGVYSVQAEKPGFIPGGYGKTRATGLPQTLPIGGNATASDLTIPLSRYATIVGRVRDEAGEPIVAVTVIAMRRVFVSGVPEFATALAGMSDETDDRGEYRLSTLIPGDYILSIRSTQATVPMSVVDTFRRATSAGTAADLSRELQASGSPNVGSTTGGMVVDNLFFQPTSFGSRVTTSPPLDANGTLFVYPLQFFPSARNPSEATVVTVRSGDVRTGLDFQLQPVATRSVSGVVTGPSGPVPNLGLGLVLASTTSLMSNTLFETATTVTDERGAFTFLGVPEGQYVLRALKVPLGPPPAVPPPGARSVAPVPLQIPEDPTLWLRMPLSVGRSSTSGLAISLETGFRVSGRIEFEGASQKPAPDAVIRAFIARLVPRDDHSPSHMIPYALLRVACDADGRLASYEIPPGSYHLQVSSLPGWTFKSTMVDGRDVSVVPLDLHRETTTLVITYTDRPAVLGGMVRSSRGAADGSAEVLLFPAEAAGATYEGSMRLFRVARADASGAYRFPALPPGDYLAIAVGDEAAAEFPSLTLVRRLARLATRVTIGDGENKTQDLTTVTTR